MPTHIALLRAVNVGGRNKVPMAELRQALTDAGFGGLATYVQSGNIVCTSRKGAASVAATISKLIAHQFGHDITVIVRSPDQLAALVAGFPWDDADPKSSGVVFLAGDSHGELDAGKFAPDECTAVGHDVYVNCPSSFADTKLTGAWVEKASGQAGTRRNWNTVLKLVEMAST